MEAVGNRQNGRFRAPDLPTFRGRELHIEWTGYDVHIDDDLWLPPEVRPTAVLSFNDLFALGVMHAVQAHGMRVPEDVSVIGCDDIPMAAYAYPPLTTIGLPKYLIGQLAVSTLLKMQQDPPDKVGSFTLMESRLIIRESTARCSELVTAEL